jgi:hypothetical protein
MPDWRLAWQEFQAKAKGVPAKRIKGSKPAEYTDPEVSVSKLTEVVIQQEVRGRSPWGWTLAETEDTGFRKCWLSTRPIPDGECAVHLPRADGSIRWDRAIALGAVPADRWHDILGQPQGADGYMLGQMRAKWTREAKKELNGTG